MFKEILVFGLTLMCLPILAPLMLLATLLGVVFD
tara:strand:- start:2472 stop:2573 length:102 start_codon:yes stop_codon:yes gene_type:complete